MQERRVAVVAHVPPSGSREVTGSERALSALAALGQPTRLHIFRLLMRHEPDGLQAKAISEAVNMAHNTLSTHLAILARAGLSRVSGKAALSSIAPISKACAASFHFS